MEPNAVFGAKRYIVEERWSLCSSLVLISWLRIYGLEKKEKTGRRLKIEKISWLFFLIRWISYVIQESGSKEELGRIFKAAFFGRPQYHILDISITVNSSLNFSSSVSCFGLNVIVLFSPGRMVKKLSENLPSILPLSTTV